MFTITRSPAKELKSILRRAFHLSRNPSPIAVELEQTGGTLTIRAQHEGLCIPAPRISERRTNPCPSRSTWGFPCPLVEDGICHLLRYGSLASNFAPSKRIRLHLAVLT